MAEPPTAWVAGAGLAGLASAISLTRAGIRVVVLEAARHAGGRCRSFHEKSLGATIDNGNHLLLSGNASAMGLLEEIGARDRLTGPDTASFPFVDAGSGEHWTVSPGAGRIPWWIFVSNRRVAGTSPLDYISIARMLKHHKGERFTDIIQPRGALYERFWDPFIVAVLNAKPCEAAAELVTPVMWETFARGADACRPLVARDGLSDTFIDPALQCLGTRGADVRFGERLARIGVEDQRAVSLRCSSGEIDMGAQDVLIIATPAPVAQDLVPDITVPDAHAPIVNLHYRLDAPVALGSPFVGLTNALAQWLFVRDDIASVTISAADDVVDRSSEDIAAEVWGNIAPVLGQPGGEIPPYRVIKEKRATFLQTPEQVARRPGARTQVHNLFLAGDWTDTGIPATIEGAIRSGNTAAEAALERLNAG